jgi:PPOX class probable F420-dependent enzyme
MLSTDPRIASILDKELIGFITAVDSSGQPQTAPVWFIRDDDDLVVYNRPDTPRLASIRANPRVAFGLRGDRRATGALLFEATAAEEPGLSPASDFPGYVAKYGREIERLGWTPESFSADYATGLRLTPTRVRSWGLGALDR